VSKSDRIAKTAAANSRAADATRPLGFYHVTGVDTVAGPGRQPAYWDGKEWWVVGWEGGVDPDEVIAGKAI
jgi:hypothetical protein